MMRRNAGKVAGGGFLAIVGLVTAILNLVPPAVIERAAHFLQPWEGGRAHDGSAIAYVDHVGRGQPVTYCEGLTGGNVRAGQRFTREQCDRLLLERVGHTATLTLACVPALPMNTAVATTSLAYNIGVTTFCRSTIARRFRVHDLRAGCNGFMAWNKGRRHGRLAVLPGLTRRRAAERDLCLSGISS